jgi:hypothetical protein
MKSAKNFIQIVEPAIAVQVSYGMPLTTTSTITVTTTAPATRLTAAV